MSMFSFRRLGIFGYFFRGARAIRASARFSFRNLGIARRVTAPRVETSPRPRRSARSEGGWYSRTFGSANNAETTRPTGGTLRKRRSRGFRGRQHDQRTSRPEQLEGRSMLAGASLAAVIPDLDAASDTGFSASDDLTSQSVLQVLQTSTSPTITIVVAVPASAAVGDTLELLQNSAVVGSKKITTLGAAVTLTIPAPAPIGSATYSYKAQLLDTSSSSTPTAGPSSQVLTVTVDNKAPSVTSIASPLGAVYAPPGGTAPSTLIFDVKFDEAIATKGTGLGNITMPIAIGTSSLTTPPEVQRTASLASPVFGSAKSDTATFTYGIAAADPSDANGVRVGNLVTLTAGTGSPHDLAFAATDYIEDLAGNKGLTSITNVVAATNVAIAAAGVFVTTSGSVTATFDSVPSPRVTPLPTVTINFRDAAGLWQRLRTTEPAC